MALIDVDYAFKHLRGCVGKYPSTYAVGLLTAADEIAKIPTIEVPRWIPVTERLPENIANKVLVAYDGGSFCVGYGHYEGRNGWINLENDLLFSDFGLTVTHWMPLPNAPKDGDA